MREFNLAKDSVSQKVNSLKNDLANFEEFGIKEKEFSELLNYEPVYTLSQFGQYLYASKILNDKRLIEIVRDIKSKNPEIKKFVRFLYLNEEDLSQGNL